MSEVTYADATVRKSDKPVPMIGHGPFRRNRGQGDDGYGKKISTEWEAQIKGETKWRKVYAICFSNVASHYIVVDGATLYLRDSTFP
jgi:hypothetical protein